MSRARSLPATVRLTPLPVSHRLTPVAPAPKTIFVYISSKKITPGDRVYPFAGLVLHGPAGIASARWRKDGGSYTNVSLGIFTDILSASRFVNEVVNLYGTFLYEIELTDKLGNIELTGANTVSAITIGTNKAADNAVNFRPFADSIIAEDPSQILTIKYSVVGDSTVAKTAITRPLLFSGTHDGPADNADLVDSGRDFTLAGIRVDVDIVRNITDGSEGVITAVAATTITATLAGGTDNDWDASDVYEIVDGASLDLIARTFELSIATQGLHIVTLFVEDLSSNESSGPVLVRVS